MTIIKILNQTVVHDDCLSYLPNIPDSSVDVIVTSPPYNLGIKYNTYKDCLPRTKYLSWLTEVSHELFRVLKPEGSFFLNSGSTNVDPWLATDIAKAFQQTLNDGDKTFILQNHIIWVKSISIDNDTIGHFKPINSKRFLNQNQI